MFRINPEAKQETPLYNAEWTGVHGLQYGFENAGDCIKRVVFEKTGITMQRYKLRCVLDFWNLRREVERVNCFYCDKFKGKLQPRDDGGTYEWIPKDEIKNLKLWRADRMFFKKNMEEGMDFYYFQGVFTFTGDYIRGSLYPNKEFVKPEEWDV